jgi:hypothetical protein
MANGVTGLPPTIGLKVARPLLAEQTDIHVDAVERPERSH